MQDTGNVIMTVIKDRKLPDLIEFETSYSQQSNLPLRMKLLTEIIFLDEMKVIIKKIHDYTEVVDTATTAITFLYEQEYAGVKGNVTGFVPMLKQRIKDMSKGIVSKAKKEIGIIFDF